MKTKMTVLAALCAAFAAAPTQAAVVWNFNYLDAAGVGFNDVANGAARQSALQGAADYVSTYLTSYTATIEMNVDGTISGGGTLASASSEFSQVPTTTGFNDQGDVMRKILGGNGADPDTTKADGSVKWNWTDFMWELGNDFQPGEYDFFSTAVHELIHALGFSSDITQTGGTQSGFLTAWAPFDEFLTDFNGDRIVSASGVLDQMKWDAASVSIDGNGVSGCGAGLLFNGPNAVAVNGGPVQIYSPNPWEGGSSGSHMDDNCYTPDPPGGMSHFMMEAQTVDGLGVRVISPLEVAMLQDIGYTNAAVPINGTVPEPATLALLLGGLGLMGFQRRRKVA